jgi:hypothetical protein
MLESKTSRHPAASSVVFPPGLVRQSGRVATVTRGAVSMSKRMGAEFFGTFWLVLGGCGSAVLAT